jgi:hypothetical protein
MVLILIAMVLWALACYSAFDFLVYWEYKHYRGNWIQDGKPSGVFWSPPELKRFSLLDLWRGSADAWADLKSVFWESARRDRSSRRLMMNWFFSTPEWVHGDWEARLRLYIWRASALITLSLPLLLVAFVESLY